LTGDNVLRGAETMAWYHGPTLMGHLETVDATGDETTRPFRFPVQLVARPNLDFRGYGGTIASGRVHPGDRLTALPSGRSSDVAQIVTYDGDLDEAIAGQAVTIRLTDEIDISRGDVLVAADSPCEVSDQFGVHLLWMSDDALYPGREYLMQIGTRSVTATVSELKYKVNVNTLEHQAAKDLHLNEIGWCNLSIDQAVPFDPYGKNRQTGAFILIDRLTNGTVGAGMIGFALRRGSNIAWQELDVDKDAHARLKSQKPGILWFTGLSGSGKSTIANLVEKRLHAMGRHTYLLDGDNVRHGLNRDLGFTDADRVENIRRVAEVSRLFVDAGVIVLVSFISPFRSERRMARETVDEVQDVLDDLQPARPPLPPEVEIVDQDHGAEGKPAQGGFRVGAPTQSASKVIPEDGWVSRSVWRRRDPQDSRISRALRDPRDQAALARARVPDDEDATLVAPPEAGERGLHASLDPGPRHPEVTGGDRVLEEELTVVEREVRDRARGR
jgi:bifunctional enzyme CysN/CysC